MAMVQVSEMSPERMDQLMDLRSQTLSAAESQNLWGPDSQTEAPELTPEDKAGILVVEKMDREMRMEFQELQSSVSKNFYSAPLSQKLKMMDILRQTTRVIMLQEF